jgi:potassium channel subfamily T protein 1
MFPKVRVCSEIVDSNNMRFMKFKSHDHFSQQISKREKIEKAKGSHIHYLFRLPFAAGSVFSASMLDTLLYQSFLNPYLIKIVRLMIGIDQAPGSGHLNSVCDSHFTFYETKQKTW